MDLSIVIPVYNASKYISVCLDSIQACPIETMECLMIDDGSSDDSALICQSYEKKDDRFRLIKKKNGGVSSARNKGLELATGKYVMFMDADDYLDTNQWSLIVKHILEEENDFTAFAYTTLEEDGSTEKECFALDGADVSTEPTVAQELMYASSQFNTCWGKLFLKDIIDLHGITFRKDLPIGEDFIFTAEYFKHCRTFYISNESILYYRQHGDSAMHKYSMAEHLDFLKILFDYNKDCVLECGDMELVPKMYLYYFRMITNLFLKFAIAYKKPEMIKNAYKEALERDLVKHILKHQEMGQMPLLKKAELVMFRLKNITILKLYFGWKAKIFNAK